MARRTRKQKAKIVKGLAVASALILLLIFVVKEILKENLKEVHDSLASAETQFRNENSQSAISLQILTTQQQIENLGMQSKTGHKNTRLDYSDQITQATLVAQQAQTHLNASFDSVSRLIDRLPSGERELRRLCEQTREQVKQADQQVNDMLKPRPDHDVGRFVQVELAVVMALGQELAVIILGDMALTEAQQVLEAAETLIRLCTLALAVLGCLLLVLGLYAAVAGIKTENAE